MAIEVNPDEPFHVLMGQQVLPLSLEQLDEAYQADRIDEATLIWQQGLGEWMRLDTVLYYLEQQEHLASAPAPELPEENYFVLFAGNDVREMNLDQLDEMYHQDVIDLDTLVWQPGFTEWVPLEVLIGEVEQAQPISIAPSGPSSADNGIAAAASTPPSSLGGMAVAQPESLFPVSVGPLPTGVQGSPWFSRSLIALASVASLFVLHQNGVTHSVAGALDQRESLGQFEERVGGPNIATAQGMDMWLQRLNEEYALDQLSETEPVPEKDATDQSTEKENEGEGSEAKQDSPKAESEKEGASPDGDEGKKAKSEQNAEEADREEEKGNGAADAFKARLQGKKPPARPARRAKPKKAKAPAQPSFQSTGDPNDPMNGAL